MGEKNLDFDTIIDRGNTNCLKYDFAKRKRMPEDLLPLWIADMDFRTSSYIQEALMKQAEHGIFGYSEVQEEYFEILRGWMKRHYDWDVDIRWLVKTPGIVYALGMAVQAFTQVGDGIMIQPPVYYPFREVIVNNQRKPVNNPLVYGDDGAYHIDFEDFEHKIVTYNVKLFFLCNPHNPVGRVWTKHELMRIGEICCRHQVIVVSDEIHADFVWKGRHEVFANLDERFAEITITCTSPGKTFNITGLQISNVFIPNKKLKHVFRKQINASGYSQLNVMGLAACEAAYRDGEEWYRAMHDYVAENISFCKQFIEKKIPEVRMIEPEGTYLVWRDFSKLCLTENELEHFIIHDAKLWLDSGKIFGDNGSGFQRINAACPRSVLEEALNRLEQAVSKWHK